MERRLVVLARASRTALFALIASSALASPAIAGPRGGKAKVQFDRGVAAFAKGDFVTASAALGKSFALKADPETLFAWAQAERRLDHCAKALELYAKLLKFRLPPANKDAVHNQIAECKDVVSSVEPKDDPKIEPKADPKVDTKIDTKADPKVDTKIDTKIETKVDTKVDSKPDPRSDPKPALDRKPAPDPVAGGVGDGHPPRERVIEGRSWFEDPVGDSLLGLGFVGLGVGTAFIISAHSAEEDKLHATNYFDYLQAESKATSRGQAGMFAVVSGGVLIATSFAWFLTHRERDHRGAVISGWYAADGGGLVIAGGF